MKWRTNQGRLKEDISKRTANMKKEEIAKKMKPHVFKWTKITERDEAIRLNKKKGKSSLLTPKGEKNQGEHLTLGKRGDEEPRS